MTLGVKCDGVRFIPIAGFVSPHKADSGVKVARAQGKKFEELRIVAEVADMFSSLQEPQCWLHQLQSSEASSLPLTGIHPTY